MAVVKALKAVAVLVVVAAVLVVFISPAIDLDRSALQAKQRAQLLFALITYWGAILFALCAPIALAATSRVGVDVVPAPDATILGLALLC